MALHGNNKGGGKANRGPNVNPVQQMTEELQAAYVKAGEDMGKQMAAAIVAIVTKMTSGQGQPSVFGWHLKTIPEDIKSIIPADKMGETEWVVIISPEISEIPLLQGTPLWATELTSGHQLLVLG